VLGAFAVAAALIITHREQDKDDSNDQQPVFSVKKTHMVSLLFCLSNDILWRR